MAKSQAQELYDLFGVMKPKPSPAAQENEQLAQTSSIANKSTKKKTSKKSEVAYRNHTVAIREDIWQDFIFLCNIDDKNYKQYINEILLKLVEDNRDDIEYFRKRLAEK